jgi:hypothetical protein
LKLKGIALLLSNIEFIQQKKAGMAEQVEMFDHTGLLGDKPPALRRAALRLVVR